MATLNTPTSNLPVVTPLEGKTTVDDKMSFESGRLSYDSADGIARSITAAVRHRIQGQTIIIADVSLLTDFGNLQSFYLCLDDLQQDYDALAAHVQRAGTPKGFQADIQEGLEAITFAAAAPAVAAVESALGLFSLFKSDVEYHGLTTAVDALAFELALAGHLKSAGSKRVFVPALMFISKPDISEGSIRSRVNKLQNAKARAWEMAGPMISKLVMLEAQLDTAVSAKDQKLVDQLASEVSTLRRDLDPVSAALARADQRLSELQQAWAKTDESTELTTLARMLRAEAIQKMDVSYIHAAIVSAGGQNRISRNLFRTLFAGDGLTFMGGVVARWALLDRDGSIEEGGILTRLESAAYPSLFGRITQAFHRLISGSRYRRGKDLSAMPSGKSWAKAAAKPVPPKGKGGTGGTPADSQTLLAEKEIPQRYHE
jgi:hypothetical protein